jgi:hypothetical protein
MDPDGKSIVPVGKSMNPEGKLIVPGGKSMNPEGKSMVPGGKSIVPGHFARLNDWLETLKDIISGLKHVLAAIRLPNNVSCRVFVAVTL